MNVVRSNEMPWTDAIAKGKFASRRKELGGAGTLGCGLWDLAPGKTSFPLHKHHVTEEALFVVSGNGIVRTADGKTTEETPIGPGDFVSFPAGGVAHQLRNDGTVPLVYIGISSAGPGGVDIVEYPESGKVGSSIGKGAARKRFLFREKEQVDYFDGEKDAGG